jgi:hypothetical protein
VYNNSIKTKEVKKMNHITRNTIQYKNVSRVVLDQPTVTNYMGESENTYSVMYKRKLVYLHVDPYSGQVILIGREE